VYRICGKIASTLLGDDARFDRAPLADFAVKHFPAEGKIKYMAAFSWEEVFPGVMAERFFSKVGHRLGIVFDWRVECPADAAITPVARFAATITDYNYARYEGVDDGITIGALVEGDDSRFFVVRRQ
jgi:hypothetical protein